jgi:hypothetical protein
MVAVVSCRPPLSFERHRAQMAEWSDDAGYCRRARCSRTARRAAARVGPAAPWSSATLSVAKKLSATALSQQLPTLAFWEPPIRVM